MYRVSIDAGSLTPFTNNFSSLPVIPSIRNDENNLPIKSINNPHSNPFNKLHSNHVNNIPSNRINNLPIYHMNTLPINHINKLPNNRMNNLPIHHANNLPSNCHCQQNHSRTQRAESVKEQSGPTQRPVVKVPYVKHVVDLT